MSAREMTALDQIKKSARCPICGNIRFITLYGICSLCFQRESMVSLRNTILCNKCKTFTEVHNEGHCLLCFPDYLFETNLERYKLYLLGTKHFRYRYDEKEFVWLHADLMDCIHEQTFCEEEYGT